MKKMFVRIILVSFMLFTFGAAPVLADTTPVPMCWPGKPCSTK